MHPSSVNRPMPSSTTLTVSSLPVEILAHIFLIAQPRRRLRHTIPFEVVVSHVCSHWRGVSFSTPLLWTNIDVYSASSLVWTRVYLERSKTCPLDVRLDLHHADKVYDRHSASRTSFITNVVDMIVPHVDRWRCLLVFTFFDRTTYEILSHFRHLAVPILRRLTINTDIPWSVGDADFSSCVFSSAPRLDYLRSETLNCWPPFGGLTTLYLRRSFHASPFGYSQLVEIITASLSLTNLSIYGSIDSASWVIPDSPTIQMNSLRALQLTSSSISISKFLLSISAPQLHSLWLECPAYENFMTLLESPQAASGLIKFPVLRYLTLQGCDHYHVLIAFPYISHLHISYCGSFAIRGYFEVAPQHLHTIALRTLHDGDYFQTIAAVSTLLLFRTNVERPSTRLLLDQDLLTILQGVGLLRENIHMELLSTANYLDPWWILAHEDSGDRI